MSEEIDPTSAKKRRVIHWNPDAGKAQAPQRPLLIRVLIWLGIGLGGAIALVFVAGGVIRLSRLVFGPQVFRSEAAMASTSGPTDPSLEFVSQSRAALAQETAGKALAEMRKLPADHPVQLQKLILIEKAFLAGESLMSSQDYAKAYVHFNSLNQEIDAFGRSVKLKHEAQQAYDTILLKRKELERARSLAAEALDAADSAAGTGRHFQNEGSFDAAKTAFDEGLAHLGRAEKALSDYIGGNIWKGQQALTQGDRETATAAFKAALEKAPGNEVALQGLRRAETIDRVYALLQQGAGSEKKGDYLQAEDAYKRAFELDAFSAAAQEGASRAARLHKETQFNSAFNAAKAAFDRKDWKAAIAEGEKAAKIYPKKNNVEEMVKTAKERSHADAVQTAIAKAFDHENKYQWNEARAAYLETLNLQPDHADAKEGYARAGRVIRALIEFEKRIEIAEERANKAEFQAGIRAFNEAMAIKPAYLALDTRAEQLRTLLMSQNQPVDVAFQSDGKTWVSISNYRNLQRFDSTVVKILPGDYEIVGRRKGYQDVLLVLQVRNGTPPPTVSVKCSLRDRG